MSFLEMLASRGAITKTSTNPNSWAAVAMWRRLFEIKKKTEEEEIDELQEMFEEAFDIRQVRPIEAPEVVEAKNQFKKEHIRGILRQRNHSTLETQSQQVPSFPVPASGDSFMYMAQ